MSHRPLDTALVQLLAYWTSKRSGQRLPARNDIALGEIEGLLARVQLVANVAGRFRYDRVGPAIVEAYGANATGLFVDEYLPPERAVIAWRNYAMVAELRCPLVTRCIFRLDDGATVRTSRVLLPLIGEYGRVETVLTAIAIDEAPRGRPLRLATAASLDDRAYALELLQAAPAAL